MKNNHAIHIDVPYKKKSVKVHLRFSEEQSDKNAQLFYDDLKKIYMEKDELRAMNPEGTALKCNR